MITSSLPIQSISKKSPEFDPSVKEFNIPPLQRVESFSPDDYEDFINEWAISCAKPKYKDVYRIGGSGDMGRDVIGEYDDGTIDYYQCKRYGKKLMPSMFWIELGKLCYYTFNKDIPMPKNYYIIAVHDLGPKLVKLMENKDLLKKGLLKEWDDKCKTKLIEGQKIELTTDLLKHINDLDFKIIGTYSMQKIIEEHRQTDYFYFRFGGYMKPKRGSLISPPEDPEANELLYINQLLNAYSDNKKSNITMSNLSDEPTFYEDFRDNRRNFYSAESLRRTIREIFNDEDHFNLLMSEMHIGICDFIKTSFVDGYDRLIKTMHESTKVNLSVSPVDRELHFVTNQDKKGLCHHLVNDKKMNWVV